jgi:hypothetical protein
MRKPTLILALSGAVLLCLFVLMAFVTNVPTGLEAADVAVFKDDLNLASLQHPKTFAEEIVAIRTIQQRVFAKAPVGKGIPTFEPREPSDLMRKHEGLCFDRSRTLDKAFNYIGLSARHVYLLYRQDRGFWSALFRYGQSSHAVTEVKTSKGWMFVDSNAEWIALTRDGQVVNADDVWRRANEFDGIPAYLKDSWWAIRGMYSRKGQLYPPYIIFPDFNWPVFFTWLFRG